MQAYWVDANGTKKFRINCYIFGVAGYNGIITPDLQGGNRYFYGLFLLLPLELRQMSFSHLLCISVALVKMRQNSQLRDLRDVSFAPHDALTLIMILTGGDAYNTSLHCCLQQHTPGQRRRQHATEKIRHTYEGH